MRCTINQLLKFAVAPIASSLSRHEVEALELVEQLDMAKDMGASLSEIRQCQHKNKYTLR